MGLEILLNKLEKVARLGDGRYKALCPAHADKTPSLAIKEADGRLLLHCFAGCGTADVLASVGLSFSDVMPSQVKGHFKKDKKPFYAIDVLGIVKFEAILTYIFASDMAKGAKLTKQESDRLKLAAARINHAYKVAKNGL